MESKGRSEESLRIQLSMVTGEGEANDNMREWQNQNKEKKHVVK